jgi:hypothetical protein
MTKIFRITKHLQAVCNSESTRYGFRHLAELQRDGSIVAKAKACYYNRTWESFDFQSVLKDLQRQMEGRLSKYEAKVLKQVCKEGYRNKKEKPDHFKTLKMMAAFANLLGNTEAEKNHLKTIALKAESGIILPDDWNTLPEEEKSRRLNGTIEQLEKFN